MGTLAAASANAINMYLDRDIDQVMRRTRTPSHPGATLVDPQAALRFGFVLGVPRLRLPRPRRSTSSRRCSPWRGSIFYVFVYTMWLKRSTVQNIVIGGAAGAVPVLVGWAAVRRHARAGRRWVLFAARVHVDPAAFLGARPAGTGRTTPPRGSRCCPLVRGEDATRRQIAAYSVCSW